jgi:catechol 2,3-dioxygenase-like lactoylglutathione lyase family enzyme
VLDHVGVPVSDFERSKRFYTEALSPLGYELIMEPSVSAAGFGGLGKPDFWISQGKPGQAFHIAFAADDRFSVDAFHEAAMAAGGRDNGGPGLRPSTMRATMEPSFSILTATTSKRSAMGKSRKPKRCRIPYSPGCVEGGSANFVFIGFSEVRSRKQLRAKAKRYGHLAYIRAVLPPRYLG